MVWGLNGEGTAELFADYSQWDAWNSSQSTARSRAWKQPVSEAVPAPAQKKKLSYMDSRDFETIEMRISGAEDDLAAQQRQLEDPGVASSPERLQTALEQVAEAQKQVDGLYERWAELEAKIG